MDMGAGAGRMTPNPIMLLDSLAAAPGSPRIVQSPLELDGYLTGIIVPPQTAPIRLHRWIAGLWSEDEPIFDDTAVMKAVLDAVIERYNAVTAEIDRSLDRLEGEKICDYQPLFRVGDGKPSHDSVRLWARGLWKAMTLASDTWTALIKGERGQTLIRPFIGFFEPDGHPPFDINRLDNLDVILDEDAAAIPHTILILRKLARLRSAKQPTPVDTRRPGKIGRNDPCPCGSGQKYKRCCARN
jgi:uncharacterized protein